MEGNPMNDPVKKMKELMHIHGIDERLKKRKIEDQSTPAPQEEPPVRVPREQTPLRNIPGIIEDARAHEKRNPSPPENDDSPNTR